MGILTPDELAGLPTQEQLIEVQISNIRKYIEDMTDEERINLKYDIFDGYCQYCGVKLTETHTYCYCEHDE